MELIFLRHAQTEWNVAEVFRGRIDVPLNSTGLKQAALVAGYLERLKIDAVYSSPLKRAFQTAQTIAGVRDLQVKVSEDLTDFNFGEWQGQAHADVRKKYPREYKMWLDQPEKWRVPGGESIQEVTARGKRIVDEVMETGRQRVALVSHRMVIKTIICTLLGLDATHFWNIALDNCGLTTFVYQDHKFILAGHNDTSFLRPLDKTRPCEY